MHKQGFFYVLILIFVTTLSCNRQAEERVLPEIVEGRYNVAFLIMDGVYNTELTAPFDIFQHTQYKDGIRAMNVFTVANTLEPIRTFEGLRLLSDYDYLTDELPHIHILVVPSAEHHLDTDLEDEDMINWVNDVGGQADYITSHCDGAFVLAQAGLLDDVVSTTFPSDVDMYRTMFPELEVVEDFLFVHDGYAITSAGGAKSFEAALYLCHYLYGSEITESIAKGLVIDWDISKVNYYNPDLMIGDSQPSQDTTAIISAQKYSSFRRAILTM